MARYGKVRWVWANDVIGEPHCLKVKLRKFTPFVNQNKKS